MRRTHPDSGNLIQVAADFPVLGGKLPNSSSATRSENSGYSSSVKRVLIIRRRWDVLYLFMAVNLLSWVDFFKRRKPFVGILPKQRRIFSFHVSRIPFAPVLFLSAITASNYFPGLQSVNRLICRLHILP